MNLETIANWASIATAFFAAVASLYWLGDHIVKLRKLSSYLQRSGKQHSMVHLMARLRITQDEILWAAFHSCHIRCPVRVNDETGLAGEILFEYRD
jgi:hypothetical protein